MATTLITGATGYIGRHLVTRLVAADERPRCLVRQGGRTDMLPAGKTDIVAGDVTDPASLSAAAAGADAIVHLASVVANIKQSGAINYATINDTGTANLVAAAKAAGVKHFIYVSGIGTVPGEEHSYIRTRWNAQQHVIESSIPYSILQPSILFGDHAAFFTALADLIRIAPAVPVPGNGALKFQPVWVEDVATCLMKLLAEGPKNDIIEIGGPEYYTYDQLLDVIAGTLGKRRLKLHMPLGLMSLGIGVMQRVLPSPPATTATLELFSSDNTTRLDAIPSRFGFQPKKLAADIAEHGI